MGEERRGRGLYSQFICVDIQPEGKDPEMVRACKREDFEKWALEKKNTKLCFKDFWLGHPVIMEWLSEYLEMKILGWEIPTFMVYDDYTFIEDDEGNVSFLNKEGKQVTEKEACMF